MNLNLKINYVQTLVLLYFLLPKIDLVNIPMSVTGLRGQDIIALILFFKVGAKLLERKIFILFLGLFLHLVYSAIIWGGVTGIFAYFRFIEYFVIGYSLYKFFDINHFLLLIKFSIAISTLQYFQYLPNFDPGRGSLYSSQYAASFGTPAELSYAMVLIGVYIAYQGVNFSALLTSQFYIFNGVKAALLGFLITIIAYFKKKVLSLVVLATGVGTGLAILFNEELLSIIEFAVFFIAFASEVDPSFSELKSGFESRMEETSLGMRVGKWGMALALLFHYPLGLFLGFGMYSQGGALDGGILRLLFEFGLVGTAVAIVALLRLKFLAACAIIAVNLLFDGYMSSVTMPIIIFFFYALPRRNVKSY